MLVWRKMFQVHWHQWHHQMDCGGISYTIVPATNRGQTTSYQGEQTEERNECFSSGARLKHVFCILVFTKQYELSVEPATLH